METLPEAPKLTQEQMERFVLAYPDELNLIKPMAEEKLNEIINESNLVEVLISRVTKSIDVKPIEAITNELICNDRVKASIIFEDRHVVEILEKDLAHYKKEGQSKWSLRKRGRLAEQLVLKDK